MEGVFIDVVCLFVTFLPFLFLPLSPNLLLLGCQVISTDLLGSFSVSVTGHSFTFGGEKCFL